MILAIIGAMTFTLAWWFPGGLLCAALGWIGALLLACTVNSSSSYRKSFLYGCIIYTFGFYWLLNTIAEFGGFPIIAAAAIFGLFVVVSALQLPLAVLIMRFMPLEIDRLALRWPIAWCVAEFIWVRIFPWEFAHTQLGFGIFAQSADLLGTSLITFIMFWLCSAIVLGAEQGTRALAGPPALFLSLTLIYGVLTGNHWREQITPELLDRDGFDAILVQGNISLREKHDPALVQRNVNQYLEQSLAALKQSSRGTEKLVLWPESAMLDWISAHITTTASEPRLPKLTEANLVTGVLTYESKTKQYNSVIAITPDGDVLAPYHKQILMPFGEYTPFVATFPWLKSLNQNAAEFSAGLGAGILRIPQIASVAPLICYEDVVPSLSRRATAAGATLLVNVTNDAWFGDTVAPHQHHLIAAWRAIENRRYLLRVTNSGFTAVVNPLGETVVSAPTFEPAAIMARVRGLRERSVYTTLFGNW